MSKDDLSDEQKMDLLVYGNTYTHKTPEGEQRVAPRDVTPVLQEQEYKPLSEAELVLSDDDLMKLGMKALISTIRELQAQLKGAQGAVDQLLNENEGLKHERDHFMDMLRKFAPGVPGEQARRTPTADEIRAQIEGLRDGTIPGYDSVQEALEATEPKEGTE